MVIGNAEIPRLTCQTSCPRDIPDEKENLWIDRQVTCTRHSR